MVLIVALCVMVCAGAPAQIKVSGNKIVDGNGKVVTLRGVNRSGSEFMCIQGHGLFDGPSDQNSINNMKKWKINVVRIPLNEDCWLAINGVQGQYAGENYISAIANFVNLFLNNDIYVILDLHWTAAGSTQATKQDPMPNRDHSIDFWKGVANRFKGNSAVIFDLFNEPFPNGGTWDDAGAWACWKNGGSSCNGLNYQAAGMQELVNAVRSTGANNIVMLGGLAWSNSFARWLEYLPNDPANQIAGSWHSYNFNYCNNNGCWNQYVASVAQKYPIIIGESGENDCNHGYIDQLTGWADGAGLSYLAWTWNTWDCASGPALITNYDGTPTNFGLGYRNHLLNLTL